MNDSIKFYLNYDMCCCARVNLKTNTIYSCLKIEDNCDHKTVA